MKDQFRLQRYELQLFYIRHISIFVILYSIALVAYVHKLLGDSVWWMVIIGAVVVLIARFWAGLFSGMVTSRGNNSKKRELVFLPLGLIIFICYMVAGMLNLTETTWAEMILLIFFIGLNIYAIYLAHYVKFVRVNRDADYMAVYHVTLGNTRAYRLWYLATGLLVLSVAILPMWDSLNSFWKRIIRSLSERFSLDKLNSPTIPATEHGVDVITPTPGFEGGFEVAAPGGSSNPWVVKIIYILVVAFLLFATYQMVRILMTKITDAKTSMETDDIIDLKKTLFVIQDEVVRTRTDDVADENAYARKIRRTFKRTVFDKFGDVDIPEKTPEELLGTGVPQENDDILLEKYEKARYSNIPCTPEDVKAVKPTK